MACDGDKLLLTAWTLRTTDAAALLQLGMPSFKRLNDI